MARANRVDIERRIAEIFPLVLDCLSLREIRAYTLAKTDWGASVSEAQLKRYVAAARQQQRRAARIDREREVGAAKLRLERIIARSAARGDLRGELAAIKALSDLLGLEAARRSEVSHAGQIDVPAAREALTELLAQEIAEGRYEPDES